MFHFSEPVLEILALSGWTKDHKITTSQWVSMLESDGYTMLPDAIKIIESFGGLTFFRKNARTDSSLEEFLVFEPLLAAWGEFETVDYWQQRMGLVLSPVATIDFQVSILLGNDGRVYGTWGQLLWKFGESFVDAMENTLILWQRDKETLGSSDDE